jgi:hypothetical protein
LHTEGDDFLSAILRNQAAGIDPQWREMIWGSYSNNDLESVV